LDAVVGVKGFFGADDSLSSVGITCALCHSTVDDSFAPGIGRRLDGWAAQDLNVGAIVSLAPNLKPLTDLLQVDEATVRTVLSSWGPGKYDAILNHDGKAFRPDGKSAATRIPPAFGLAGHNLETWGAGWGTVTYWNAYVANTQMMGIGTFYDPRLNDPAKYPIAARTGRWNIRNDPDLITPKLGPLHFYQLGLEPPEPPRGSFNRGAAKRGEAIFNGKGTCANCHVEPLTAEPGYNAHKPAEICIDDFQANRSPDNAYVTAPLNAIFTKSKRGFYHDGRFPTLDAVVEHYNNCFGLELTAQEKADLVEFLKSR
jgi:mono/diheme cytochrome c family protein